MAKVSIYLNFPGTTEAAFNFYKSIFKTEFDSDPIRMGQMATCDELPELNEDEKNKIMHISMPILGETRIMATDMLEKFGQKLKIGNNTTINLEPDSREELDRLFNALSDGGSDITPPRDMPWAYWACCLDKFGIRWMFNFETKQ